MILLVAKRRRRPTRSTSTTWWHESTCELIYYLNTLGWGLGVYTCFFLDMFLFRVCFFHVLRPFSWNGSQEMVEAVSGCVEQMKVPTWQMGFENFEISRIHSCPSSILVLTLNNINITVERAYMPKSQTSARVVSCFMPLARQNCCRSFRLSAWWKVFEGNSYERRIEYWIECPLLHQLSHSQSQTFSVLLSRDVSGILVCLKSSSNWCLFQMACECAQIESFALRLQRIMDPSGMSLRRPGRASTGGRGSKEPKEPKEPRERKESKEPPEKVEKMETAEIAKEFSGLLTPTKWFLWSWK